MKDKIYGKSLMIALIFMLIVPTIAVASYGNGSPYNLKIKIKNAKLFYNWNENLTFLVNVSNEGPGISDNYIVTVKIFWLISYFHPTNWFQWTGSEATYTGAPLPPNEYNKTVVTCQNPGEGLHFVRATVNSNTMNNHSFCLDYTYALPP